MVSPVSWFLLISTLLGAFAQQFATVTPENHPTLPIQHCAKGGSCVTESTSIVLDSNWRWVHNVGGYTNCYTGNTWNSQYCPDPQTCSRNCALDGADYPGTYGISTSGNSLQINFKTGSNVGSRMYLLQNQDAYKMFQLKNREFTFDVDVSQLPCGLNGALYFVSMDQDGGKAKYPLNNAGARYGTGYCDAQCPHDIKFINGEANLLNWSPSSNNPNSGVGQYGSCCVEMDIWEANSYANAYTPHPCNKQGQYRCSGTECGDDATGQRYSGVCDKDGCDLNPYRNGNRTFFGPGSSYTINTQQKFTVITQFLTSNGQDSGSLTEIRRLYKQNGKLFGTPAATINGIKGYTSVSDSYCSAEKQTFGDINDYAKKGGTSAMGTALDQGMVLVMSLWDDYAAQMLWLDSDYPVGASPSQPGVARGPCATTSGKPSDVENQNANSHVQFSNIKYGDLNSTY